MLILGFRFLTKFRHFFFIISGYYGKSGKNCSFWGAYNNSTSNL